MTFRTRITAAAKERGLTAAEIARCLGLYRSNLSAMDAGTRSVSMRQLARIAGLLDCGPGDLLEVCWDNSPPPFKKQKFLARIREREQSVSDGADRRWLHRALLAWQRHDRSLRSSRET